MLLNFELEAVCREVEANSATFQSLCAAVSKDLLAWRPAPEKWSLAHILEHLNLTTRQSLAPLDRALDGAEQRGLRSVGPFRLGFLGRFYVWYVEPPPKLRLPAPKALVPQLTGPPAETLAEFLNLQQSILERIRRANGIDLNRTRVRPPFAPVSMDLLTFFSVTTAHQRRHVWQARFLVDGLPTSSAAVSRQ